MNPHEQMAWQRKVICEEWTEELRDSERLSTIDEERIDDLLAKRPETLTLKKRSYLRLQIEH